MIRLCADAVVVKISRQRVGAFSAGAINNPTLVGPGANKCQQLVVGRRFWNNAVSEIRPIKACYVAAWLTQFQLLDDVAAHPSFSSRGKRHDWRVGEVLS